MSLTTNNPHTKKNTCKCTTHKIHTLAILPRTCKLYEHTKGQAISIRSKEKFQVSHNGRDFPFADVRVLSPSASAEGLVNLEFFFDGEIKDLSSEQEFIEAVISHVSNLYTTALRAQLTEAIEHRNKKFIDEIKTAQVTITEFKPNTIRDAGCMLRFVAVRLALEPRIAAFVGKEVFPEDFGGEADLEDDRPLPRWFSVLILACLVAFVAVVFAWGQILKKALESRET